MMKELLSHEDRCDGGHSVVLRTSCPYRATLKFAKGKFHTSTGR